MLRLVLAAIVAVFRLVCGWWTRPCAHGIDFNAEVFCPDCRLALVDSGERFHESPSLSGFYTIRCPRCETISRWDWNPPVPLYLGRRHGLPSDH